MLCAGMHAEEDQMAASCAGGGIQAAAGCLLPSSQGPVTCVPAREFPAPQLSGKPPGGNGEALGLLGPFDSPLQAGRAAKLQRAAADCSG